MTNTFNLNQFNISSITYPINLDYVKQWVEIILLNDKVDYSTRFEALCSMFQDASRCDYFYNHLASRVLYKKTNETIEPIDWFSWFENIEEAKYFYELLPQCIIKSNYDQNIISLIDKAKKSVESTKKKRQRLKRFIENHCFKNDRLCYFITYTFNDEALKKKEATRKKEALKFLKGLPGVLAFALNKDFGELNDREHYHIILSSSERLDYSLYNSNIDFEICNTQTKDKEAISKYIVKLSNHGVKASTKMARVYYFTK